MRCFRLGLVSLVWMNFALQTALAVRATLDYPILCAVVATISVAVLVGGIVLVWKLERDIG